MAGVYNPVGLRGVDVIGESMMRALQQFGQGIGQGYLDASTKKANAEEAQGLWNNINAPQTAYVGGQVQVPQTGTMPPTPEQTKITPISAQSLPPNPFTPEHALQIARIEQLQPGFLKSLSETQPKTQFLETRTGGVYAGQVSPTGAVSAKELFPPNPAQANTPTSWQMVANPDGSPVVVPIPGTNATRTKEWRMEMDPVTKQFHRVERLSPGGTEPKASAAIPPPSEAEFNALVDKVGNYEINPNSTSMRGIRDRILGAVAQKYPNYDQTQYAPKEAVRKSFTSGPDSKNITSLNTVIGHMDTMNQLIPALANSGFRKGNQLKNFLATESGLPQVKQFIAAKTAVQDELASVFKQTGATDISIQQWKDQIDSSDSPEQLKNTIQTIVHLLGSRMSALKSKYETGVGEAAARRPLQLLNDKSKTILQKYGFDPNQMEANPEGVASQSGTTRIQGKDKRWYNIPNVDLPEFKRDNGLQ